MRSVIRSVPRAAWITVLSLVATGCLTPGPGSNPEFYRPPLHEFTPGDPEDDAPTVALRPIVSAGHLRDRIVWRVSDVRLGYYEDRRWTDGPAQYVRQTLLLELFGTGAARRVSHDSDLALLIELLAFDEVLEPEHVARLVVAYLVEDDKGRTLSLRTFAIDVPIDSDDAPAVARAFGVALDRMAAQIRADVEDFAQAPR